jgi:hypothetical protein
MDQGALVGMVDMFCIVGACYFAASGAAVAVGLNKFAMNFIQS